MTNEEKNEIANIPAKYQPLSAWAYFWYGILFSIPLIGFICLIVFSFSSANINRRSYARSYFCALVLVIIIAVIVIVALGGLSAILSKAGTV